jgi:hypothetical protein
MAPRTVRRRARLVKLSGARARLGPATSDLVVINRALADLAEFLQLRQEAAGRGRVILDRRVGERRYAAHMVNQDRRQSDRRRPPLSSAEALMRVLGFIVIPTAAPPAGPPSLRGMKRPVPASRTLDKSRRATRGHRTRPGPS